MAKVSEESEERRAHSRRRSYTFRGGGLGLTMAIPLPKLAEPRAPSTVAKYIGSQVLSISAVPTLVVAAQGSARVPDGKPIASAKSAPT